jgi:hypothetical protein
MLIDSDFDSLSPEMMTDVTAGSSEERKLKVRRMLECAIPALPTHAAECFVEGREGSLWAEHQEKRSCVRLLSFSLGVPQMQIGSGNSFAKNCTFCKNYHS